MYLDPKVTYLRNVLDPGNTNKSRTFAFLSSFNLALGNGGLGWSIFVLLFCFLKPSLIPRTRIGVGSWVEYIRRMGHTNCSHIPTFSSVLALRSNEC